MTDYRLSGYPPERYLRSELAGDSDGGAFSGAATAKEDSPISKTPAWGQNKMGWLPSSPHGIAIYQDDVV